MSLKVRMPARYRKGRRPLKTGLKESREAIEK